MNLMKEHYLELLGYENWAMQKIIPVLSESRDADALKLFSHILFAREIWFNRISGQNNPYDFDGKSLEECVNAYQKNQTEWIKFIESVEDFEIDVNYQTTEGKPFSDKLKNILTHVVNHSTYHRGQITNTLKEKIKLPSTDFIFYLREI